MKTARPDANGNYSFRTRREQLETAEEVELWYVFLARLPDRWLTTLIFPREDLRAIQRKRQRVTGDVITFAITFHDEGRRATLGSEDLSRYIDNWDADWPVILAGAPPILAG